MNIAAKAVATALVIGVSASSVWAAEGFLMVEKTVAGTTTRTTQVQIERDRMRAELSGPTGGTQIVIFDGPQQVLRIISVDRKSYTEMTKADADRRGAQMVALMAGMKEKMEKMPPEQRAKMAELMGRLGGAGAVTAPVKPDFRRAGSDKVGKWTCDKYEGFRNGEKVSEVCTVDPKILGLTAADFEISKQVASFFQTLMPQGQDQIAGIGTLETQGFSGIPVRRVSFRGGAPQSTSEVTEVTRQTFADSTYDVPAGFQKQVIGGK